MFILFIVVVNFYKLSKEIKSDSLNVKYEHILLIYHLINLRLDSALVPQVEEIYEAFYYRKCDSFIRRF